jgi:hypothetical protein
MFTRCSSAKLGPQKPVEPKFDISIELQDGKPHDSNPIFAVIDVGPTNRLFQRTQEGDVGILAFDEPITDEVFLQYLRLHGIYVYPPYQDYTLLPNGLSFGF